MTRDDTIKLMQQACDPDKKPAWHNEFWTVTQEELERFAALVAEAEREACAQVCDTVYYKHIGPHHAEVRYGVAACAAAIRARGTT